MRKNPLTVLGTLEECLLFMFHCPVEAVRHLVPDCFEPVSYKGNAIIGVVVSRLKSMRPWPLPGWMGIGYRHIAYRIYVQYTPPGQATIQGLYFLRSEADHTFMTKVGNLLTDFRYHRAEITVDHTISEQGKTIDFQVTASEDGMGHAEAKLQLEEIESLSPDSCFSSLVEAMDVLHYEPYGIFYDDQRQRVNVVKVVRDERQWREKAIRVVQQKWTYLDHLIPQGLVHELTVQVDSIPYRWERGVEYALT